MSPTPSLLLEALATTLDRVAAIDLVPLEGATSERIHAEVAPQVDAALASLLSTLGQVLDRYEGASPTFDGIEDAGSSVVRDFERGVDALVDQLPSAGRVADLAFMANLELRQRRARVATLSPTDDPWKLLATFDSARRRARKSATAVATVLAEVEGLEHGFSHASELTQSLLVRVAYAKLRRQIEGDGEPTPDQLETRLRHVGTHLVILAGKTLYRELRIEDRVQLQQLRTRILEWLADAERTTGDGMHLWQDLTAFASILALVNQRQELLQHDAHIVKIAIGVCRKATSSLPPPLLERMAGLKGLTDEVDHLLEAKETAAQAWRPVLDGLAQRLRIGSSPVPPSSWPERAFS
ncbi:MAG: hypothetical protein KC619_29845 [Myxococcales bacterium]|nr:hypothetical protein [Myxococcales bacterium]